jgi:hypothetical protein
MNDDILHPGQTADDREFTAKQSRHKKKVFSPKRSECLICRLSCYRQPKLEGCTEERSELVFEAIGMYDRQITDILSLARLVVAHRFW